MATKAVRGQTAHSPAPRESFGKGIRVDDQDPDVEGHSRRRADESAAKPRDAFKAAREIEDVEGHAMMRQSDEGATPAGEGFNGPSAEGDEDLDDVEGHNFLPDPGSARVLWRARDAELTRRAEHGRAAKDAKIASDKRGR